VLRENNEAVALKLEGRIGGSAGMQAVLSLLAARNALRPLTGDAAGNSNRQANCGT